RTSLRSRQPERRWQSPHRSQMARNGATSRACGRSAVLRRFRGKCSRWTWAPSIGSEVAGSFIMRPPECKPARLGEPVGFSRLAPEGLFPLDGARRLAGHVINDAVDATDFVDDAGRGLAEEIHVELIEVGSHAIDRGYCAQGADKLIGATIAHDAHGLH